MSGGAGPVTNVEKDKDSLWYFSAEQLANSPSRRHGIDADQELSYRQMTAYLIQEMGQRLQVSQLCINTAIVYMHRFYAFHSFTHFHRNNIAAASLFLAAKVEEQPRKLEHVIKAANKCLNQPTPSTTDAYYIEQAQELVFNENVLLQTLGFDVAIDHPHTHVVKTCHLVKACKDLAQTSYFLASNSLHLTSMCLQYKPTVVACFCIYLACKWSRWEIPQSTEGKHWFHYVDKTVTMDLLKQLTDEFIAIYEKSPSRLKSKLNSIKALAQGASNRVINKEKKGPPEEWKMVDMMKMYHSSINTNDSANINNQPAQTVPYPTPSGVVEQQQQTAGIQVSLLPQLQQQIRKTDQHSSQHRSHHNSSSHHSKLSFPSGDVHDHKSSHKQTNFNTNVTNRPRDHGQTAPSHQVGMSGANTSRSSLLSSSGRSSGGLAGQNARQQQSQSHQLDVNYHKSREKSNLAGSFPHGVPAAHAGQKVTQKQDSNRVIQKEPIPKMSDQGKQSSSKMFSVPPIGVATFGGTQILSSSQPSQKIDISQDMTRGMVHNQRTYGVNNGSTGVPLIGYQTQTHPRQSSSSNKNDPSKSVSVQMQQPQHTQHKPIVPPDTSYGMTHEPQQHVHQLHSSAGYTNVRSADILHSEDQPSAQISSMHPLLQQPASQSKSLSSMFSPDWDDKLQQSQLLPTGTYVNSHVNAAPSESFNFKMSLNTKESPKKGERDRGIETPLKKERNRNTHSTTDNALIMTARSNTQSSQQMKIGSIKKPDSLSNANEPVALSAGVKRPNDGVFKQEDDIKIRRLDVASFPYSDIKSTTDINKLQVVNGIETNPDLVRSLLKESLCTSNALIKSEDLPLLSHQPPAELFDSSVTETPFKMANVGTGNELAAVENSDSVGGKQEKKKKKDKHKHKEKDKDKTKDREEKKKHKKEKDKHKERDRESENSEHVKIKISKEKLEGAGGSSESFKIKIPKDRIISDINCGSSNPVDVACVSSTPALKIKISKDKLENYSSGSSEIVAAPQTHLGNQSASFYSSFITPGSVSGPSHSSKKKERDRDKERDREKEKKRSCNELLKSNGGTYTASGGSGSMPVHMPTTSTKTQNSSKFKELS